MEICVKITTETGSKPSQYKKLGKVKNIAVAYEMSWAVCLLMLLFIGGINKSIFYFDRKELNEKKKSNY